MKTKKKLISQKPTELDVSLKYCCPQCKLDHWLFLREAQTKNYKVVCECGAVFKPKRISKLRILYNKHRSKSQAQELPFDIIDKCVKILVDYGFDAKESKANLEKAYRQTNLSDIASLVKTAIKLFGEN
jgi:hypothetical protein